MPIAEIETPDGRIMELDVPEGATENQILAFAAQQFKTLPPLPKGEPVTPFEGAVGLADDIAAGVGGVGEAALTLGSSVIAEPIAGLAGIAQTLNPFAEEGAGARAVEATREALTFQPRTGAGQIAVQEIGEALAPIGEAIQSVEKGLGDVAFDITGSPAIAAGAASTPTLVAELLGLKGLKSIRKGTKLIDDVGRPTRDLAKVLDKQGLDFDNLTPETRALIPQRADPKLLPSPKSEVASVGERAVIEQIKSGAKDDALAGLKVVGNRLEADNLGQSAIKQGFRPGFVQSVKTATPQTKQRMLEMLDRMRRIKKQERLGVEIRPSDVVGDSVNARIRFIRDAANDARLELNDIAKNRLAGKDMDGAPIVNQLQQSLNDLDVRYKTGPDGVPKLNFKNSMIAKDKTSKRIINDLVDLMAEGGRPDALRFHKLKRQLDTMIDFRKKSAGGLTDAGRGVLKDIRSSLNNSLRAVDSDYARVNDTLSSSLDALGDLDKAVGSSIDIFERGSNKAIGTRTRALLSNQQGRVNLENALDDIEQVAANLGGRFDDNIKDLIMFSDGLDDRFGAVAKTSFQGQVEQGVRQAVTEGVQPTLLREAAGVAGRGLEGLRGINDFNAFNAMEELLKRGQ